MRNHYSNLIQQITEQDENFSLSKISNMDYISLAFAKSRAERRNSNLYTANTSTPFNDRAFFVRSTRTPKECYNLARSSMMACNGKGSPFAVFRVLQFSTPLHAIARIVENSAIAPKQLNTELSAMIYKFLTLNTGSKRLRISIFANSLEEALSKCQFTQRPLLIARLNPNFAKNRPNLTACNAKGGIYA